MYGPDAISRFCFGLLLSLNVLLNKELIISSVHPALRPGSSYKRAFKVDRSLSTRVTFWETLDRLNYM